MSWPTVALELPTIRTSRVRYGDQWAAKNDTAKRGLKLCYARRLILKSRFSPRLGLWGARQNCQKVAQENWIRKFSFARTEYKSISGQVLCPSLGEAIWDNRLK